MTAAKAILTYHSLDESGSAISLSPKAFERHLQWIRAQKIAAGSMLEFAAPTRSPSLSLTFDDGFLNFATEAWPRLKNYGLTATLYVVAGRVGTDNNWTGLPQSGIPSLPLLDWDALARMASEGLDLGCHSLNHPDMRNLPTERLQEETAAAAELIADRSGYRPKSFCYPFGHVDEESRAAVAGVYEHAVTTEFAAIEGREDPHLLPRIDAYYFEKPGILESFGTRAFEGFIRRRRFLRRLRRFIDRSSLL